MSPPPSSSFGLLPCCLLRPKLLPRRRVLLGLLGLLLLAWLVCRRRPDAARPRPEVLPPPAGPAAYGAAADEAGCRFPDFVLRNTAYWSALDEDDDPTARARVGPSPQLYTSANFTVIYNFASPKPKTIKRFSNKNTNGADADAARGQNDDDDDDDDNYAASDDADEEEEEVIDEDHVTYATHVTPEFLYPDVLQLLSHWPNGHPISVSVFAPGPDFCLATAVISWLWNCNEQVRRQASFHVFFPSHFANDIASKNAAAEGIRVVGVNCSVTPAGALPVETASSVQGRKAGAKAEKTTYRQRHSLPYPVNVARNVARTAARTKYVLTSDVELYPSAGLADNFIDFVKRDGDDGAGKLLEGSRRKAVFVVPVFEVAKGSKFPANKAALVDLYSRGEAVYFHQYSCKHCQKFPGLSRWIDEDSKRSSSSARPDPSVRVFLSVSRRRPYHRWEPIYIGTQEEPLYDERLSWEGYQDKMSQARELCLLDYRFVLLDTAFLVHKPGIKRKLSKEEKLKKDGWREPFAKNNSIIYEKIVEEFLAKYSDSMSDKCPDHYR